MKSKLYNCPHLHVVRGDEIHLSGQAVLELLQEVLSRGFPFRFKARGWSMTPFIRNGDVITITPINQTFPRLGDVVAFTAPGIGKLIVHRIVAKRDDSFIILGDGIGVEESLMVPRVNILGRIQNISRNGQTIWLGIGPERVIIATLSRTGLLIPLHHWLASCKSKLCRRANQS